MISLPPYILLILFAAFLLFFLFFGFANIVSLARYGAANIIGFLAVFIFIAGSAVILFLVWQNLPIIDLYTPIPLFTPDASLF